MRCTGLPQWSHPVRTLPPPPRLGGPPYSIPLGQAGDRGLTLADSGVQELGRAGVARNFEWRGPKPGGPSTPLPAGCPQLGEGGTGVERAVRLGWESGVDSFCPGGLPILK